MEALSKIFGGRTRVKIMRMFLLNPGEMYRSEDVSLLLSVSKKEAETELVSLKISGFLIRKFFPKELKKRGKIVSVKFRGFCLNEEFLYLKNLEGLLVNTLLVKNQDLLKKVVRAGNIHLVVIAGVFIQDLEGRVDLLIVGEKIRKGSLHKIIRHLESNIGKELKYAVFDINDFSYRLGVGDRLIRDIFDFKHKVLLDKIGLTPFFQRKEFVQN